MELKKETTAIICLSPYAGGMEIDSIKLAKKLSSFTPIVLIARSGFFIDSKKKEYIGFNNINLELIDFKSSFSFNIIFQARRIIKEYGIKNIVFFGASELKSLYFSFLGLDINLIVRHGTTKSRPKKDWFHKMIYSDVNYHVSICNHLLKNVREIIPFGRNTQEKLIYSSFQTITPLCRKHNKLNLLHVGRIAGAKGQVDAIKACEILVENNIAFELNIVGGFDESYKDEFNQFYENCDYKEKINLVGFTNDTLFYIQKADIFIFPSYGEGLSNSFLEAMSNNIICIAYSNTSFPELKDLGLYFRITKDRDIEDLKNNLLNIAKNLVTEKRNSSINYNLIKKLFSEKLEVNKYKEILI